MDVAGDFPEEFDAINNRCKIFQMSTPLKEVIPSHIISFICKRKREACKFLIDYFNDNYDKLDKSLKTIRDVFSTAKQSTESRCCLNTKTTTFSR